MFNMRGANRGFASGGGMGFGFRGSSPPWPYVGRGRGGLPRCGYFLSGTAGVPAASQTSREQEIAMLQDQQRAMKDNLEQIEVRIKELAGEK